MDLKVNHIYRAKKPGNISGLVNDRQILWIGLDNVQYDSPAVKSGARYPQVSKEKFLSWAGSDVTEIMPKGEWASWPPAKPAA